MDHNQWPLVEQSELESTAPCGLYRVARNGQPVTKVAPFVDCWTETDYTSAPLILLARVREGGEMPIGVELVARRADGKQLILQWALEQPVPA